jgi:hypothetical protein
MIRCFQALIFSSYDTAGAGKVEGDATSVTGANISSISGCGSSAPNSRPERKSIAIDLVFYSCLFFLPHHMMKKVEIGRVTDYVEQI